MKKTLYIVVLLIVGLMLGSCNKKSNPEESDKNKTEGIAKNKEELKKLVKELDKQCPYEISLLPSTNKATIQSIELKDDNVKITFIDEEDTDDEEKNTFDEKFWESKEGKQFALNLMSYSFKKDEQLAPLFSKMVEAETGLMVTDGKHTIQASVDDVRKDQNTNAKDIIKSMFDLYMMENETDDQVKLSVEGNYVVFTLTCDEDETYQQMAQNKGMVKYLFLERFTGTGGTFGGDDEFEEIWKESGLGIKIIIANADTGDQFVLKFENDEL